MDTLHVLTVDDEPAVLQSVTRVLRDFTLEPPDAPERLRFDCENATDGESALLRIKTRPPDILLLDYKLPGLSGIDLLERIRKPEHEMLTIMITGYASLETAVNATRRGAYNFVAKPFTPDELTNAVAKAARHLLAQRQAQRLAEERRQARFQFVSMLSHELQSPLAAVEGYLQIVRDQSLAGNPASCVEYLERALARTQAMRKMIADLLDLTRIESGQRQRELQPVDVCAIAREAIATAEPLAAARSIRIELITPQAVTMNADRSEIECILNNLLSNAVKYNRDGGRVEVEVGGEAGRVRIRVADTGIGMTAEEIALLFREFSRVKNPKTRHILGSGLGLSIVRKLAELYDGTVTVDSQPDVGSTFTVVLGARPAAVACN